MNEARLPVPTNSQAERAVLGAMLRDNECIADVLRLVSAHDFGVGYHAEYFAAMLGLWDARQPVDLVTLRAALKEMGDGKLGETAIYLVELWDAIPTAGSVLHHAAIVRDYSLRRQLHAIAEEILRSLHGPSGAGPEGSARQLIEQAEAAIFALSELGVGGTAVLLAEALDRAFRRIDDRAAGKEQRLLTGFVDLDRLLGGLQDGELVLLAARPSVGKTALGVSLARNVALNGAPVFFASLEQSQLELAERILSLQSRVNSSQLRHGKLEPADRKALGNAYDALSGLPFYLDDWGGQSVLRIAANARRIKSKHGLRAVFIDYLQLITPEDRRVARHEQIGGISRRLKLLARELNVPVVALAQLNREVESRKGERPRLADLRDSGELEQNADVVWLLHQDTDFRGTLDVLVAKQRNGPTGSVRLTYRKDCYLFENYAGD